MAIGIMLKQFILLLPSFVCLYAAVNLCITRKSNFRSQNIWMVCMLAMSACSYIWGIFYGGVKDFKTFTILDSIDATLGLTLLPFIYIYLKALTDETPLGWKEYIWFLPGLFTGSSTFILYKIMGETQATTFIQHILIDQESLHASAPLAYKMQYAVNTLYYIIFFIQIILSIKLTITNLIKYRSRLNEFLSDSDATSLQNIRATLIGIFGLLISGLLAMAEMHIFPNQYPSAIFYILFGYAVMLYYTNFHVTRVKYTAESLVENIQQIDQEAKEKGYATADETDPEQKSPLTIKSSRRKEIALRIESLLDKDKLFLKKDVRMDDFVHLAQANRTYISLLISEEYGCNFSELINRRRIDYAKELATTQPNLSHTQIAEKCGFSHPSSFSRSFKQHAGTTFRDWHKSI